MIDYTIQVSDKVVSCFIDMLLYNMENRWILLHHTANSLNYRSSAFIKKYIQCLIDHYHQCTTMSDLVANKRLSRFQLLLTVYMYINVSYIRASRFQLLVGEGLSS